jgi:hypothetical protein
MRLFTVCVDHEDLLAITLPYNVKHFSEVNVITDERSYPGVLSILQDLDAPSFPFPLNIFQTDAFYADGAAFNKWKALELGLSLCGRHGWICLMDADVLLPKSARFTPGGQDSIDVSGPGMTEGCSMRLRPGTLCSPLRRMKEDVVGLTADTLPPEKEWCRYPIHRNVNEWAGYCQIFRGDDPVLVECADCGKGMREHEGNVHSCRYFSWHQTNWKHAGGADSFFQQRWARDNKLRPPFEVLHLGPAGVNWCGRTQPRLDGTVPEQAGRRQQQMREMMKARRVTKGFDHERL